MDSWQIFLWLNQSNLSIPEICEKHLHKGARIAVIEPFATKSGKCFTEAQMHYESSAF